MRLSRVVLLLALLPMTPAASAAEPFPFQIPWDDDSANLTNLSGLNHTPAGDRGWIVVSPDGHFELDGQRQRFLGVNITADAAFLECVDAPLLAHRLARMGINVVRFHHIDNGWTTNVFSSGSTTSLDETVLERLDCLVAALKQEGVYINMNLLVSRTFVPADGLPASVASVGWKEQQTMAMFDPSMLQLQKNYAAQLLGHVNPFTGLSYLEDPAIAFVEILNEHGLIHAFLSGLFDTDLPPPFDDDLKQRWNAWLLDRYETHEALAEAWVISSPQGNELLLNNDFSQGLAFWETEEHEQAQAVTTAPNEGPAADPAARLEVTHSGTQGWHIQFKQQNLSLENDTVYTLRLDARASRPVSISVALSQQNAPWANLGFSRTLELTSSWQSFSFTLQLAQAEPQARLIFSNLANGTDTFWFDNLSLRRGGTLGLLPEEDLDSTGIQLFSEAAFSFRRQTAQRDWMEFLWDLERSYWDEMYSYLKLQLGYPGIVNGTIMGCSTANLMARYDAVDTHSYWQHPQFDVTWGDPWWFMNSSMLTQSDGGTITSLANRRVFGKPHTVTEYNTAFPNSFGAETFPLLAAYGAFQDWDALYAFAYYDGTTGHRGPINGFFDPGSDPAKMLGLWNAALLFRRNDVSPATTLAVTPLDRATELNSLPAAAPWSLVIATTAGSPRQAGLLHRVALLTEGVTAPTDAVPTSGLTMPADGIFDADTGELHWDTVGGVVTIDTPRSKAVIGAHDGATYHLGGVTIRPTDSDQGYAVIHLQLIDGVDLATAPRSAVVTALGWVANSNMQFIEYPSTPVTGPPPPRDIALGLANPNAFGTAPVIAEGIGVDLVLPYAPDSVTAFALDERGNRTNQVPVGTEDGRALLQLHDGFQTLWYEITIGRQALRRGNRRHGASSDLEE